MHFTWIGRKLGFHVVVSRAQFKRRNYVVLRPLRLFYEYVYRRARGINSRVGRVYLKRQTCVQQRVGGLL